MRTTLYCDPRYEDWPDRERLSQWGPLLPISIRGRQEDGEPSSESFDGMALVDTGASSSAVSPAVAEALNLRVIRQQKDQRNEVCLVHPVCFTFENRLTLHVEATTYTLAPYIVALIGRDVLRMCVLVYDGSAGSATLELAPTRLWIS
jgi:hypothetical protein